SKPPAVLGRSERRQALSHDAEIERVASGATGCAPAAGSSTRVGSGAAAATSGLNGSRGTSDRNRARAASRPHATAARGAVRARAAIGASSDEHESYRCGESKRAHDDAAET